MRRPFDDLRQPPREAFTGWLGAARRVLQTILALRVTAAGQVEELAVKADAAEVTDYEIEFGTEYRVLGTGYWVISPRQTPRLSRSFPHFGGFYLKPSPVFGARCSGSRQQEKRARPGV